jgi:hypothetical protein
MVEINSPLGRTSFKSSTSGEGRVLTVEDASEQQQAPRMSFSSSPVKINTKERSAIIEDVRQKISNEARQRIDFLIGMGKLTGSVTVDDVEFTFKSLDGGEQTAVYEFISNFGELNMFQMQYEIRFATLALALTHIQGKEFSAVIESDELANKVGLVKSLDEKISDRLFKWYQENIVDVGNDKYGINSEEDAKEVVEDIKKS